MDHLPRLERLVSIYHRQPIYVALAREIARIMPGAGKAERLVSEVECNLHALTLEYLPSGGGFDNGCLVDIDKSTARRSALVISAPYRRCDGDSGLYDAWVPAVVAVSPDLATGIRVRVTGAGGRENAEYIASIMHKALHARVI